MYFEEKACFTSWTWHKHKFCKKSRKTMISLSHANFPLIDLFHWIVSMAYQTVYGWEFTESTRIVYEIGSEEKNFGYWITCSKCLLSYKCRTNSKVNDSIGWMSVQINNWASFVPFKFGVNYYFLLFSPRLFVWKTSSGRYDYCDIVNIVNSTKLNGHKVAHNAPNCGKCEYPSR